MDDLPKKITCIIPAGGSGIRMGLPFPKQLAPYKGRPLILHIIELFRDQVDEIIVAVPLEHEAGFHSILGKRCRIVLGGASRFDSVRNGFFAISKPGNEDLVIIHDAARPFFNPATLKDALKIASSNGALIYATPATDTIKQTENGLHVSATLDRNHIFMAQTPQIFRLDVLENSYRKFEGEAKTPTDEAEMVEACGFPVALFRSTPENRKLTHQEDLKLLQSQTIRIGHGFDVHRFDAMRPLILCGVQIPEGPGLLGHSDADVAIHALMDAILGACSLGDIGQHFPDTDPNLKGVSSLILLEQVLLEMKKKNGSLVNLDLTILAQAPKLAPFRDRMRQSLAQHLNLDMDRINLKATTTEGLGYIGKKRGMAAHCVVLVEFS